MSKKKIIKSSKPFIDLRQDLMFKLFFSKNERVLLSLIQSFIVFPKGETAKNLRIQNKEEIKNWFKSGGVQKKQGKRGKKQSEKVSVTLEDSSVYPDFYKGKGIVLDLLVGLNTGEKVNIEMQTVNQIDFIERILYYWASAYKQSLKKGEPYLNLKPTYSLVFVNFPIFRDKTEDFLNGFSICSKKPPHFTLTNHFDMTIVDLSRFAELEREISRNWLDMAYFWCYFMNNSASLTENEKEIEVLFMSQESETFKIAVDNLKSLSTEENVRFAELQREKVIRDSISLVHGARYAMKKGRAEGMQQGMQQGMQKGMQQGMQKGIAEGLQKGMQQVALNMLKEGLDITLICKMTGLSKKEIKNLKK